MDQYFVVKLGVGAFGAVVVFGEIGVAKVGKHVRERLIEMLVALTQVRVGVPPLRSLSLRIVIERFCCKELVMPFVETDKPADEDFGFVSGSDFVDMGGKE